MQTMTDLIETVKKLRDHLKIEFAGTNFSVKSDPHPRDPFIRVSWAGGPSRDAVDGVISLYRELVDVIEVRRIAGLRKV